MVAYDYRRGGPAAGPSLGERLMAQSKALAGASFAASQAAAAAASKAGKEAAASAQRAAKAKTSSEFEKLLMRATAPMDTPVMGPDMSLLFAEIRGFPRKAKRRGAPNPYEKTLHKLWTKMLEPDWRTTVKGVGVLHRVSRDAKPQVTHASTADGIRALGSPPTPHSPPWTTPPTRCVLACLLGCGGGWGIKRALFFFK
jgi:hypothetical protein